MTRTWILIAVLLLATPVAAQQTSAQAGSRQPSVAPQPLPAGSLQVTTASLVTTGDTWRTGGLQGFTPDLGVTWFRPTTSWGTLLFDVHAARGDNDPRLGRALFSITNMKRGGLTWNVSAGDSLYKPFLTDYGFNNLFAPQVTFRGASVSAKSDETSVSVTAGRTTLFRDLFAANVDMLGQSLFVARASHKATRRIEVVAHASRVRTEDLKGMSYLVESGDDVGAGVRVNITKTVQFIGDAGITSYRRKGSVDWEQMPSMLVGARWTGKNGSLQLDAHRFSPGNFSVVNNPYADREGLFAAGEYKLANRLRMFGGWDMFRNNRQAQGMLPDTWNRATSSRGYGGANLRINSHLSVGGRVEDGARVSQPSRYSVGYESDTGAKSVDWQVNFTRFNAVARYERRSNVNIGDGMSAGRSTFTQHDGSASVFFNVTRKLRMSGSLFRTERRDASGGGQSFWQASAGTSFQIAPRSLSVNAEIIMSRDQDMQTDFLTPRSAFAGGLSAQIARHVMLALDVYIDRSPVRTIKVNPWMSRTMVRLVYNVPTGASSNRSMVPGAPKLARGSETIEGTVFVDWNGNGTRDANEETVTGVRLILDGSQRVTADEKGRFRFDHITAGEHLVTLDVPTVPADFDPPALTGVDIKLRHADIPKVSFGLAPLGDIDGVVLLDVNGNAAFDESDRPVDGAVVVLDDGSRTEVARDGMFRFSGVRTGRHTLQLLLESLPDDASLIGDRQTEVVVSRDQRTPVTGYLLRMQKRPEIRKTFAPKKNNNSPNNNNSHDNGGRLDKNSSGKDDTAAGKSRSGTSRSSYSRSRNNSKSSESRSSK